jgi:hypothetical protein
MDDVTFHCRRRVALWTTLLSCGGKNEKKANPLLHGSGTHLLSITLQP